MKLFAVVYNTGRVANELKAARVETYVVDEKKNNFLILLIKTLLFLRNKEIDTVFPPI